MPEELNKTEARAGRTTGRVRWILAISTIGAAVILLLALLIWHFTGSPA
jgi:hypothetical protein